MKLNEILDGREIANRLDILNKDKRKSAKTLIKLLRQKANRTNRKTQKTKQDSVYANHDALVGYSDPNSSLDQNVWK